MLLKRGGRGNVENGISTTGQGKLATECPACPHAGKNLPPDWQDAEKDERWIYGLSLAIDANFRLKLKERKVDDPEFGPGWAYFVNDDDYKEEIQKHPQPKEVRIFPSPWRGLTNLQLEKRLYLNASSHRTGNIEIQRRILGDGYRHGDML